MVDLHTHILPHLDDGAFDLETSVRMADLAARSGVFHMAATSHGNYYDYMLEEYRENFERLQAELRDREIPVKLYSGMEIFMDEKAADLLDLGELLTLNGQDMSWWSLILKKMSKKCINMLPICRREGII